MLKILSKKVELQINGLPSFVLFFELSLLFEKSL